MHLKFRNINEAFQSILEGIDDKSIPTIKTPSRNGPVLQVAEPLIVTYTNPRERVLFNQARDCNPFFHMYESLWMLAGRNDVAPLDYYTSGKYSQFSDDGKTANGAYGYRWRRAPMCIADHPSQAPVWLRTLDQLGEIIDHLKAKPESRRAVLQMWNVEDDLLKIDSSRDVCCNLSVMFSIRTEGLTIDRFLEADHIKTEGSIATMSPPPAKKFLDMTVTNRSNDLIWGLLGANQVHFGFLQEYVACALGVEVGVYNQMTNNAHVYTETNSGWHPNEWLSEYRTRTMHSPLEYRYGKDMRVSHTLFADQVTFDAQLNSFVESHYGGNSRSFIPEKGFLKYIAHPMCVAYESYKKKDYLEALGWCEMIIGDDWRTACILWLERRQANAKKKEVEV